MPSKEDPELRKERSEEEEGLKEGTEEGDIMGTEEETISQDTIGGKENRNDNSCSLTLVRID